MITGLGFTEIMAVLLLVLIFFGSKEVPRFIRETARLLAKARAYSDKVRRELDEISRSVDPREGNIPPAVDEVAQKKNALRRRFCAARAKVDEQERREKATRIVEHLMAAEEVRKARAVMVYASMGDEVPTSELISRLQEMGKRVVLPYCRSHSRDLGIAAIEDIETELAPGAFGVSEPIESVRDNFFKSDLHVVVCPGVGFDTYGGRLGRGKAFYDNFLRELSGKVPVYGVAFDCQISRESFPFDYHDVPVDQVVTESGLLIGRDSE